MNTSRKNPSKDREQKEPADLYTLNMAKMRLGWLFLILGFVFFGVVVWLFYLQIWRGDDMKRMADAQSTFKQEIFFPRGKILDRNGQELAVSIMSDTLIVNPWALQGKSPNGKQLVRENRTEEAARKLAPVLGIKQAKLKEIFNMNRGFYYVKRQMEEPCAQKVRKIIKDNKFKGFTYQKESKRYYTKNSMAAQVLGFVGTEDRGRAGLELSLDSILKSMRSENTVQRDARSHVLSDNGEDDLEKIPLSTVYLTLDSKMQFVIEDALDDAMARTQAKSAAIIIMDPKTGAILAMGSRPTFDPNRYWKYPAENWRNRGISFIYEPGSIFKPIVGCMGLTEGIITPDTLIKDEGNIRVADRVIKNWNGKGNGIIPFSDVIKYSINTGMVQLGMALGARREIEYSKNFGFGKKTGVDLPGEEAGILYQAKNMYDPDVATFAIGQGLAASPLQMLRAICAIANGGELLQPYIVDRVISPNGELIKKGGKKVIRRVLKPEVAAEMRTMMESVVDGGGGKTAAIKGYRIAGKTGTAQKLAESGRGYGPGQYIASFVGFVPADNPQYAMLVMLDTPKGAFYGSQVSAPIFRDTLQQILVAKGVQPGSSEGLTSFEDEKDKMDKKKIPVVVPELISTGEGKWKIPDFTGLDIRTVAAILAKGKLVLLPEGSGNAVSQYPKAGAEVEQGSRVKVSFR